MFFLLQLLRVLISLTLCLAAYPTTATVSCATATVEATTGTATTAAATATTSYETACWRTLTQSVQSGLQWCATTNRGISRHGEPTQRSMGRRICCMLKYNLPTFSSCNSAFFCCVVRSAFLMAPNIWDTAQPHLKEDTQATTKHVKNKYFLLF
jgi:hypothetical protein